MCAFLLPPGIKGLNRSNQSISVKNKRGAFGILPNIEAGAFCTVND